MAFLNDIKSFQKKALLNIDKNVCTIVKDCFEKVLENKKVIVKKQKGLDKFMDTEEEIILANLDIV